MSRPTTCVRQPDCNRVLVRVSQVKFYSIVKGNHLTWGTPINRIEVEGKGEFGTGSTGAAAFQTLTPTNVSFF